MMEEQPKAPGVFVEEIRPFPLSIAQVETAIPAFIGYTANAGKEQAETLVNKPVRIGSMVEYGVLFGAAPSHDIAAVHLTNANQVSSIAFHRRYYMYESLRMFYANGGRNCYIISVGDFTQAIELADFQRGLEALALIDDPTLLLAPDAVGLAPGDMYTLYQTMLMQCNSLKDRFSILDLQEDGNIDWRVAVSDFRKGIGTHALRYGAAYTPWIQASSQQAVAFSDFHDKLYRQGSLMALSALVPATNREAIALANRLADLSADIRRIGTELNALKGGAAGVSEQTDSLFNALKAAKTDAQNNKALNALLSFSIQCLDLLRDIAEHETPKGNGSIRLSDQAVPGSLQHELHQLLGNTLNSLAGTLSTMIGDRYPSLKGRVTGIYSNTGIKIPENSHTYYTIGTDNKSRIAPHLTDISKLLFTLNGAIESAMQLAKSIYEVVETAAKNMIPELQAIMDAVEKAIYTIPPSGGVAGVYARTDADRGVWKAPANAALNHAIALKTVIDDNMQGDLNVHTDTGISINAIRRFPGKGVLVWGARTLAGNDNEWRYVSVRRFVNMVEESTIKGIQPFVFEPNDANTWRRVRSMVENFLTLQWRSGALAGAKPTEAFFVRVGLGHTMTAQDILEGIMHIEIGLAVLRPAEFILVRISQKAQDPE
jgi:uncharacterized protein